MICNAGVECEIHRIEKKYQNPLPEELISYVQKNFKYIGPQGGPMTGTGNEYHRIFFIFFC
jgi:ribonucleoside-diphosphate reductase alpha chain